MATTSAVRKEAREASASEAASEIVTGGEEDDVGGFEVAAAEVSLALQVADHGFDG